MAVTGMANLAIKVADLDAAVEFYERAGAEVSDRMTWNGGERTDVYLGPPMIALFTDDLDRELVGHTVAWGPAEVSGNFGVRRIASVEAPGGIRLEFMEQIEEPR